MFDPDADGTALSTLLAFVATEHGWNDGFYQQHCADADIAERADAATPHLALAFALAGLYLKTEHGFDGRRVQVAHARLSRAKERVPVFRPRRSSVDFGRVATAMKPSAENIDRWCGSVWAAYSDQHDAVRSWVSEIIAD